jgi:hypothetical protein
VSEQDSILQEALLHAEANRQARNDMFGRADQLKAIQAYLDGAE